MYKNYDGKIKKDNENYFTSEEEFIEHLSRSWPYKLEYFDDNECQKISLIFELDQLLADPVYCKKESSKYYYKDGSSYQPLSGNSYRTRSSKSFFCKDNKRVSKEEYCSNVKLSQNCDKNNKKISEITFCKNDLTNSYALSYRSNYRCKYLTNSNGQWIEAGEEVSYEEFAEYINSSFFKNPEIKDQKKKVYEEIRVAEKNKKINEFEEKKNKYDEERARIEEAQKKEKEELLAKEKEEKRIAEEKRKAKEAEEKRIAEEKRKAKEEEEKRIAEAKKKEEEAKQAQQEELYVIGSGTGFFVNKDGYIITNEHVAGICQSLASYINGETHLFRIIALDKRNDLALLRGEYRNKTFLNINVMGAEFGEDIMAFGFPLAENLSSSVKLTRGIVSSLSGPENDISLIQIDAAIQPGNSGGPVLNYNGQVVGVASSGLNKIKMLLDEEKPYIPENVNFAVAATTLTGFLKSNSVKIFNESFDQKSSQELAKIGMPPTIQLHCLNTIAAHNQLRESENYSDVLLKKVVNLK